MASRIDNRPRRRTSALGWVIPLWYSVLLVACQVQDTNDETDILLRLQNVPDVVAVEELNSSMSGWRYFHVRIEQFVDHRQPSAARFEQRATLLYRSDDAPTVIETSGYSITDKPYLSELAAISEANFLVVEHRYFAQSTPPSRDWAYLTIEQAAHDHHRVVTALQTLLHGAWISTGSSKGGMTALYYRRFFPHDVQGTVAYVAPNSHGDSDPRYIAYLLNLGSPEIWEKIDAWQQAVLDQWSSIRALYLADLAADKRQAELLGPDQTLELALREAPFTLWQYGDAELAAMVPSPQAQPAELYDFFDRASFGLADFWNDDVLQHFAPYYYQAATQLGYPQTRVEHLHGLPSAIEDRAASFPPLDVPKVFDAQAMLDIQDWIDQQSSRVILVYGENDPYTAAAFTLSAAAQTRDNARFIVPHANHGAQLSDLDTAAQTQVQAKLERWMGTSIFFPAARHEYVSRSDSHQRRWPL